jgi:hypothetical protein
MGYRLGTISGKSSNWHYINDPTPEEIERAIDELLPVRDYFLILVAEDAINDFIQTLATDGGLDKEIKYQVEIRFEYGSKLGEDYKHYQYFTTNTNELKRMFRMYALGIVPDLIDWTDITEELEAAKKAKKSKGE